MLLDSAKIQEDDAKFKTKHALKHDRKAKPVEPLYKTEDVVRCMDLFVTHGYEHWFKLRNGVEVMFRDAGHILGSASVTLRIEEKGETYLFGFTGDIGRPNRPILHDPKPMPEVDFLITESTYGDRLHESAPAEEDHFLEVMKKTCVEKKGKLIIPAFSVGRTQEIVYMLDQLERAGKLPPIPVYVDSPLAINATMVFGNHPECFDAELHEYMLTDPNPFGFNGLTYIHSTEESKLLNASEQPCVIISAAGMMNAGRIQHHIFNGIDKPRNTLLIVGYCSPNTLGGKLRQRPQSIHLFGIEKSVLADIVIMDSFSAHADRNEMADFLQNQRQSVKQLFLVHGVYESQVNFRSFLLEKGFRNVEIPYLEQEFALGESSGEVNERGRDWARIKEEEARRRRERELKGKDDDEILRQGNM
jgi:metallo-beta-lactamase family protein